MAVDLPEADSFHQVEGVSLAACAAGIGYQGRDDLSLVALSEGTSCAAMFTTNAFAAAPVRLARQHLAATSPRYWLINAGNANAITGNQGMADALQTCRLVADIASVPIQQVIPYSTGVIGERLPLEKTDNPFSRSIPGLYQSLDPDNWSRVAKAIMTTDTRAKGVSIRVPYRDGHFTVNGIVKGAGMIHPNMATMLAFIATDLTASSATLEHCLQSSVEQSFHRITVDGDTSTNDAVTLAATGRANLDSIDQDNELRELFTRQLDSVCTSLAQAVIRDAEGATRFVTVTVNNAASEAQANAIAKAIALSPLVKTALFAGDPNWGRILCAAGYAAAGEIEPDRVDLLVNGVSIVKAGERDPDYSESRGTRAFAHHDLEITVDLHIGTASGFCHSCDLGHDYVRINADYRS